MKTKLLFITAALLGALAILWMAVGFIGANPLALLVTAVIGFVYALGLVELMQFRSATANLAANLAKVDDSETFSLQSWLDHLHPSLRNSVGQRIEGEKVGLPAPVFSPYLVGLLVMLGLLGTFVGMVDTMQGAVTALQGSTELVAIRAGLAAPIQGLSLAFGTSVAGIAASAMLGLNATLSRRERMLVTRQLDHCITGPLRQHSLHYNRQQTYQAMQSQAQALPEVAQQLGAMAGELERMGQQLSQQLLDNQERFHQSTEQQYQALASSVESSLRDTLTSSGKLAGESIAPAVEQAMGHLTTQATETQQKLLEVTEHLLQSRAANEADWLEQQGTRMQAMTQGLREDLASLTTSLGEALSAQREEASQRDTEVSQRLADIQSATAEQLQAIHQSANEQLSQTQITAAEQLATLQQDTAGQLGSLQENATRQMADTQASTVQNLEKLQVSTSDGLAKLQASTTESIEQLQTSLTDTLQQLNSSLSDNVSQLQATAAQQLAALETTAATQLGALETTAAEQLAGLGRELQDPMSELIATASETPRAAAEVIGKLREEVSNNMERDNQLLEERKRILEDLSTLSSSLQQSSAQQQAAIEQLVSSSGEVLAGVSEQFSEQLNSEADKLSEITADAAGSAADIASLGESFSLAVQLFSDSNSHLVENLGRIEASMEKSTERSDEQMSYYVAQAREIIDQSMLSQREIIEELRRLGQTGDLFAAEAS
jgi:hypothetical protein